MSRRSELQRKLESLPAPKPPANLADLIKSEIPHDLRFDVEEERERLSSGIALNLRAAASLLVLISTAYLAMHVMWRASKQQPAVASRPARQVQPAVETAAGAASQTVAALDSIEPVAPPAAPRERTHPAAGKIKTAGKIAKVENRDETPVSANASDAAAPPAEARGDEPISVTAAAPVMAPPPPAAAAEAIRVEPQAARAAQKTEQAAPMRDARTVNDAVIQQYAAPDSLPTAPVLDVEAVEEPVAPHRVIARVSFDTGVLVRDLWVDTTLNEGARSSVQWLNASWRWGSAEWKRSRTSLVAFALPDDDPLFTVRARYRLGDDPIVQTVEKVVRRSDVRAWSVASPRTKRATLAALWQNGVNRNQLTMIARQAGLIDIARVIESPDSSPP